MNFTEHIIDRDIGELAKEYDLVMASNTNIARQFLECADGLKPVQRRICYIMFLKDGGKNYRKVETISGEVLGRAHPHGSTAISEALVNMAQDWKNSIPLIDGFGNFGSVAGDVAGAPRYITARLSEYARACFFDDWKDSVVDMEPSYNEEDMLPIVLPAKYPNVLINGCNGIGHMGMSCLIPCFNFREVVESCIRLIRDPRATIVMIPDAPTGADVIQTDFLRLCETGNGSYMQRCTYDIDPEKNVITITALPMQTTANAVREKIADLKESGGLPELLAMNDLSGKTIDIQLVIRDDVNPYKFMRKLIKSIPGLERTYPVNITVVNNLQTIDYSIKDLLLDWIDWRREQKRVVVSNKRTNLMAEQRINDVKIFIMNPKNLDKTVEIFRKGRNRAEIEKKLVETYHDTEIRMDSLQARALSNMRMVDLCQESYEACLKRKDELEKELADIETTLNTPNGIDKLIIAELQDGLKRFGKPRKSNVVPYKISISNEQEGVCVLQLSSDGMILRKPATNADEEPIPTDSTGFACLVDNDSSFIIVDDSGYHTFIRVKELPIDSEVPVSRYAKKALNGNIIAMLPVDIDSDRCCTLISRKGILKRVRIADIGPSKRPLVALDKDDKLVRGIVLSGKSTKEVLIYTRNGYGQRIDPNAVRVTSPLAKGTNGFKLGKDDEIIGCYTINPEANNYLLYVSNKQRCRLNLITYLPVRNSKYDQMVKLITLNEREKLVAVVGCNKFDKAQLYFDDGSSELLDISKLEESTMASEPKKYTKTNAVSVNVTKVKIV